MMALAPDNSAPDPRRRRAPDHALGRILSVAATLALALTVASPATAADRTFALIVGHNTSDDPKLRPLRYADDDALRYGELFGHLADEVVTLATLDDESRRMWGQVHTTAPTRRAVLDSLTALRQRMAAARAAGDRPVLFFVYSGHGNYDAEGRGYVHLKDGRFTTRDLYRHVIAPSGDDPVVLLVDACNAALLVHSRGGGPERRPAGRTTLKLEAYPNVGVILASSSVAEVHEWGRYLAGIFSHEVRSALLGPADVDDDHKITFAELAAFIAAANARVHNPTVRLSPYIRPPLTEPNLALVDLDRARFPARVRVDESLSGKAHLVDENLVRYADFHKDRDGAFWLAIPREGAFVLVHGEHEHLIPEGSRGPLQLADLERRDRTVISARGAGSDYFDRTLFHEAYSDDFAATYLADDWLDGLEVRRFERVPWYQNRDAWVTFGSAAAILAAGATLQGLALREEDRAHNAPWADARQTHNTRLDRLQTSAYVTYGVGGAALLSSVLWFALDRPVAEERYRPPLKVSVTPGGVTLRSDF